jgi:hypothetical protein
VEAVEAIITANLRQPRDPFAEAGRVGPDRSSFAIRTDRIYLLYTGIEQTLSAARAAAPFAKALGVPLTVVHFRTIPYPLAVDAPPGISPIETAAFLQRLRHAGLDARIHVYLCRNDQQTMPRALRTHSLIVLGGHHSAWWPSRIDRSRRLLEAAGYFVIFVETSARSGRSRAPRSSEHPDA